MRADVEVLAGVGEAEVAVDDAGGGGFKKVTADRGVDQDADLLVRHAAFGDGLLRRHGGRIGGLHRAVPHAPGIDAGDIFKQVFADAQALQCRFQAHHDLGRRQALGRVDMGDAGNRDVFVMHGCP
jgi:hypothetical protein